MVYVEPDTFNFQIRKLYQRVYWERTDDKYGVLAWFHT